ncbi:Probable secretory pathway GDP dissociation inhibitor 1 [Aduncisulcus paluster]|uniref:Rab GDP dissociation inhibitor n=1 Tax=Aduncisulcus paluster TaxID=2918883 RepID=A0ABQ5K5G3_9EUKA|nr:Probable secretory pathway GDP dissociation inhibitor 1 [Aduncisulcus paluster]
MEGFSPYYDAIILGTGLKECLLSGLLSVSGYKVLHIDKNSYYGAESASLNIQQLYQQFRPGMEPPKRFGATTREWKQWNIDLFPKFVLSAGALVSTLVHTNTTHYLNFKVIDGSYVYSPAKGGCIHRVPATVKEAIASKLMKFGEKRRMASLLELIQKECDPEQPSTRDLTGLTMKELFAEFSLQESTQDFIGHAMGLWRDDSYLERPAKETCDRIFLYARSLAKFGSSPYIYPEYGLGELPQGFSRLASVFGGVYMIRIDVQELLYNEDGTFRGIRAKNDEDIEFEAYAKWCIGAPSYFPREMTKVSHSVARAVCILDKPIAGSDYSKSQKDKDKKKNPKHRLSSLPGFFPSCQIIIPQKTVHRRHDVYVSGMGTYYKSCPPNFMLGYVSTTVETDSPRDELKPGLELLNKSGGLIDSFETVNEILVGADGIEKKSVWITSSYDETSHFETSISEVMELFEKITGEKVDLSKPPSDPQDIVKLVEARNKYLLELYGSLEAGERKETEEDGEKEIKEVAEEIDQM